MRANLDPIPPSSVTAIVLNGGRSERMGRDKGSLVFGDATLLQRVAQAASQVAGTTLVVGGSALPPTADRLLPDAFPDTGPLGGLLTGLRHARGSRVVVVSSDLPFLLPNVLRLQLSCAPGFQAVVPIVHDRKQPLHAVYDTAITPIVQHQLSSGRFSVVEMLDVLNVRWLAEAELRTVDHDLRSFINVNTPVDWARTLQLVGAKGQPAGRC